MLTGIWISRGLFHELRLLSPSLDVFEGEEGCDMAGDMAVDDDEGFINARGVYI